MVEYQNKINPVASEAIVTLSENDSKSLNDVLQSLGEELQTEEAVITPGALNSKSFLLYNQKRIVLNERIEEFKEIYEEFYREELVRKQNQTRKC